MNYEFPTITNISDVLPAIAGRDEFVVAEKEGYTVINYNVMMADTFDCNIRRECRGIIFDTASGEIIRRPFHKFFNVNEREETQDHAVDLSRPHAILEKLDGSMIAPFIVNGKMIWGTKMGATDVAKPVEEFVVRNPDYIEFAEEAIHNGLTPIFEWCSRKQRIVLDYSEDQLILTAIRDLKTGNYWLPEHLIIMGDDWNIPVVRVFDPQTDMKEFIEYVRDLEDLEGFVVRFGDGHMLKLKCDWYVQIHKAKEAILQDRNIVELILDEKLDDIKAHLPVEDRECLTMFEDDFNTHIEVVARHTLSLLIDLSNRNVDRKDFAINEAPNLDPYVRPIMFKNFSAYNDVGLAKVREDVHNTIRNNLGRTVKYEAIRDAWFPGVKYNA
jgi:RNA ligase